MLAARGPKMSTCCNCAGTPPPTNVGSCCYLNGEDIECTDVLLDDLTIRMTGPECHILPQGIFHVGVECHQVDCVTTTTTAAPSAYCFEQVSLDLEYCFRQNSTIKTVSEQTTSTEYTQKGRNIVGQTNTRDEDDDPPPPPPEVPTPPKPCYEFPNTDQENKYLAKCNWVYDDFLYRKRDRENVYDYNSGEQFYRRSLGVDLIECEWDGAIKAWSFGHCLCSSPVDKNGVDIGPRGDKVAALTHFLYEGRYLGARVMTVTGTWVTYQTLIGAGEGSTQARIYQADLDEFFLYGPHLTFPASWYKPFDQAGSFVENTSCYPR